jgi:chromosome segregation ATPase
MSKIRTLQDTETESEQITIKKSALDNQMGKLQTKLHELNSTLIQKGGETKEGKEKLNLCYEALHKMKAERDTLKQQTKSLNDQIEKMKNSHKPVEKIKGFDTVMTGGDIDRGIDKYYNDNCKKRVDDFKNELNKLFE